MDSRDIEKRKITLDELAHFDEESGIEYWYARELMPSFGYTQWRRFEEAINRAVEHVDITIEYKDGVQQVILNGENVTGLLRTEETGRMASKTSKYAAVRTKLVDLQRKLAQSSDVIMDGRDIGTTVLPDAFAKIYLTASTDARAKRRYDELNAKGEKCDYDVIRMDIEQRDYQDMHREISPLKQAEDAVLVDTSDMNIEQVVEAITSIVEEKKAACK